MQIRKDDNYGAYSINSYQPGTVVINNAEHHRSVIVTRTHLSTDWQPQTIEELAAQDCQDIIDLKPEIILLGTGEKLIFPDQKILAPLYQLQFGVEVMDTHAACRTFKVLLAEDRNVLAALMV